MKTKNIYNLIAILAIGLWLNSCNIIRNYQTPEVSNEVEEKLFRDQVNGDTTSLADLGWSELFTDPQLQALINEGLANNNDYKIAILRVATAQSIFKQSKQELLPSVQFNPNVTFNKQSKAALNLPSNININLKTTTVQLPVGASWELDIWGKIASAKRSALADYLGTHASARAVQTQLVAAISSNYFQLLALDEQLAITLQTIELREKNLLALEALKDASLTDGAAVAQTEANLRAAEIMIPDLKKSIREAENALSILLGRVPGPIERSSLGQQEITSQLNTGIPLQLLKNRPDVEAAEMAFRSNFEQVNVARASFYPSLTISAQGGLSALTSKDLLTNSIFTSVAAGLLQPIYQKGRNKKNLQVAQYEQEQSLYAFQQSLLVAGQEVSDALYAYEVSSEKETIRIQQVTSLQKSVDFTKQLVEYSTTTNYLDVITAEQNLLSAQLNGVNDHLQKLLSVVNLYRALGGGWK